MMRIEIFVKRLAPAVLLLTALSQHMAYAEKANNTGLGHYFLQNINDTLQKEAGTPEQLKAKSRCPKCQIKK